MEVAVLPIGPVRRYEKNGMIAMGEGRRLCGMRLLAHGTVQRHFQRTFSLEVGAYILNAV